MPRKILFLIPFLVIFCFVLIRAPKNSIYFIPFDEGQVQDHYSPSDLIHFYQRLKKNKWKKLQRLYSDHLGGRKKHHKNSRIPKIIHQIWLGSPFPEKYRAFQQSWISQHPDWEYHLWTDKEVEFLYLQNRSFYEAATNYGQKSDILRYEILCQFGGIYVDTDFECLKPLDILVENCDFFSGLSDHIHSPDILNGLIGSVPNHPVLIACIQNLHGQIPSHSFDAIQAETGPVFFKRVFFNTIKKKTGEKNVILPATYFYPIPWHKRDAPDLNTMIRDNTFAIHHWEASWTKKAIE